jgi:hypothetical protein
MSIWILLCTYTVEFFFSVDNLDLLSKSQDISRSLSLTSDALFWRVSAMSVFGRCISPSILLRFEPAF